MKSESDTGNMLRFLGNIEAKVDNKGRIFFPAAFRKVLESAGEEYVVVRKDVYQPCLVVYPGSVWNAQMDHVRSRLNRWNAHHQQIFRQYVSDVERMEMDGSGRVLMPRRLLEAVGIGSVVRFIGMGDSIELWPAAAAQQPFMDQHLFVDALESLLGQDAEQSVNL